MSQGFKHTYARMNMDLAKNKYPGEVYYEGRNVRILTDNSTNQSSGGATNYRGTSLEAELYPLLTFAGFDADTSAAIYTYGEFGEYTILTNNILTAANLSGMKIIGFGWIREDLYLFFSSNDGTPNTTSVDGIALFDPNEAYLQIKYLGNLGFSSLYPIDCWGYFETENIQKLYWLNGFHQYRFINIIDPDIQLLDQSLIDIIPEHEVPLLYNLLSPTRSAGGSQPAGVVQYFVGYLQENGQRTKLTPFQNVYPINDIGSGNSINEDVAVSILVRVDNVDTSFDRLIVYRARYTTINTIPQVDLIYEEPINSDSISFYDYGQNIAQSSFSELLSFLTAEVFIPNTHDIKDERVFLGNNVNQPFEVDFDSRAYRFDNTSKAVIKTTAGASTTVVSGVPGGGEINWDDVPDEHDCINPSNKAETNRNYGQGGGFFTGAENADYKKYIYQSDGSTLGAEGPNMLISFNYNYSFPHGLPVSDHNFLPASGTSFNDPSKYDVRGFMDDEVYRVAVRFYNSRNQWTQPQWICDLRIPTPNDNAFFQTADGINTVQLTFTVEFKAAAITALQNQGVVGFQVMTVERTPEDSTVLGSGFIAPSVEKSTDSTIRRAPIAGNYSTVGNYGDWTSIVNGNQADNLDTAANGYGNWNTKFIEFTGNQLRFLNRSDGYLIVHSVSRRTNAHTEKYDTGTSSAAVYTYEESLDDPTIHQFEIYHKFLETDHIAPVRLEFLGTPEIREQQDRGYFEIDYGGGSTAVIGYNDWDHYQQTVYARMNKCIFGAISASPFAVSTSDTLEGQLNSATLLTGYRYLIMANYKVSNPSQYGGDSYATRSRNLYIPASKVQKISTGSTRAIGDVFTVYELHQRSEMLIPGDFSAFSGVREVVIYPTRSLINEDIRNTELHESSNANTLKRVNVEMVDFFNYNDVYGQLPNMNPVAARSINYKDNNVKDVETRYSDLKSVGEFNDSWTVFREGNKKNLDGRFGKLTALIENKDILFFIQERAYGYWLVNPKEQFLSQDGTEMIMGRGAVLEDKKYLSTNSGSRHKFSVVKTPVGVFFYNEYDKEIQVIGGTEAQDLASIAGIKSKLNTLPDTLGTNPLLMDGVSARYDFDTDKVLMSFAGPGFTNFTTVFGSKEQTFVENSDFVPALWCKTNADVFVVEPTTRTGVHSVYTGPYGSYFGTVHPMDMTVVVNNHPDVITVLTNLLWNSEVYNEGTGVHIHDETITHIRIQNDYQDSGFIALTTSNLKRLMRQWRFTIPYASGLERFRSQYFFVTLRYDNVSNRKIVLQDLTSYILPQPL